MAGPEALLLSARLAEHRALRLYGDLEMSRESSMYVEVCVRSQLTDSRGSELPAGREGAWSRLRTLVHRNPRRPVPGKGDFAPAPAPWIPACPSDGPTGGARPIAAAGIRP